MSASLDTRSDARFRCVHRDCRRPRYQRQPTLDRAQVDCSALRTTLLSGQPGRRCSTVVRRGGQQWHPAICLGLHRHLRRLRYRWRGRQELLLLSRLPRTQRQRWRPQTRALQPSRVDTDSPSCPKHARSLRRTAQSLVGSMAAKACRLWQHAFHVPHPRRQLG